MATVTVIEPKKSLQFTRIRVAAYARVSSEKELSENSFKAQVEYFSKKISSNPEWINAGIYADYGITGTKTARPGFENLIKACENGQIDMVITKSISRFCRNTVDLLNTTRHLKNRGINVFFERENIYSMSSEGELLLSLLASYAQEESRSISENTKWAIRKRFEQGIGNWSHLYGYKWDGSNFHIIDEEANVIRKIFSMYIAGNGPKAIVTKLKAEGITRKNGTPFTYSRIVKILNQEKYSGNSLLQKTFRENHLTKKPVLNRGQYPMYYAEGTHPAIISEEEFEQTKSVMRQRREQDYKAGHPERFSCFTGKIVCAACGHTYRRVNKDTRWPRYVWKCGTKISHGSSTCNGQTILEKMLISASCRVLGIQEFNPSQFEDQIDRVVVQTPYTLTFHFKDDHTVISRWKYNATNKQYKEVNDGKICNDNTSNLGAVFIQAATGNKN